MLRALQGQAWPLCSKSRHLGPPHGPCWPESRIIEVFRNKLCSFHQHLLSGSNDITFLGFCFHIYKLGLKLLYFMGLLRSLNDVMGASCLAMWAWCGLCSQKWRLSLQHPDWASGVWGVEKTGSWEQVGAGERCRRGRGSSEVMGPHLP